MTCRPDIGPIVSQYKDNHPYMMQCGKAENNKHRTIQILNALLQQCIEIKYLKGLLFGPIKKNESIIMHITTTN